MPDSRSRSLHDVHGLVVGVIALIALHVAGAGVCLASPTSDCPPQPRPQDAVWLVSSRGLGCCGWESNVERLKVWRFDRDASWLRSDMGQLLGSGDSEAVTVVFLHGNRIDHCDAFTEGWIAYRRLTACADQRPVRFVIWSWPSARVCGPIKDARTKAARTDAQGYYLARFVEQFQAEVPVNLWGYSFGARIATGALHLLGGGTLVRHRLETRAGEPRRPMQAVLLAPALDDDWLLPGHRHGDALPQLDGLLLVNNGCDLVLKRYRFLGPRRCCRQALGYVGLPVWRLPTEQASKVCQIDACCYVGKRHRLASYLGSPTLMARMRTYLLFADKTGTMDPQQDETPATETLASDPPAIEPVVASAAGGDPLDERVVEPASL
jgi:hypothetical protein